MKTYLEEAGFTNIRKCSLARCSEIFQGKDNPAYGRVDFAPLQGGVVPSGVADGVLVTAGTAVSTAGGAETGRDASD